MIICVYVKLEIKNQIICFNNFAVTLPTKYHFPFFFSVDNLKKYRIK